MGRDLDSVVLLPTLFLADRREREREKGSLGLIGLYEDPFFTTIFSNDYAAHHNNHSFPAVRPSVSTAQHRVSKPTNQPALRLE